MGHRLHRIVVALACCAALGAGLSCGNGGATPLATTKAAPDMATMEAPLTCEEALAGEITDAGAVAQAELDRWLAELAGSFAGYRRAVARSNLTLGDGTVLVRSGEVVRSIAGRSLDAGATVLRLHSRLVAPRQLSIVSVQDGEPNAVRMRVVGGPSQAAFRANADALVVRRDETELHVDRLRFRALRAELGLMKHSAQWRGNGEHGGGLRLVAACPGWLYYALGLRAGDLLRSIDGVAYGSTGQLQRALYTASLSPTADQVRLALTRDGAHTELVYRMVGPSYRAKPPRCR